jgi:ApaG protein
MTSAVTDGVQINVEVFYQNEYSNPILHEFMFAYKITITNLNHYPIKLLRRRWEIFDSNGVNKTVEGEGVVGAQPIINADASYNYMSACGIKTDMGKMHGFYTMLNLNTNRMFNVTIPQFNLIYPFKHN